MKMKENIVSHCDMATETTPLISKEAFQLECAQEKKNGTLSNSIGHPITDSLKRSNVHTISTSLQEFDKSMGVLQGFMLTVGVLVGSGVYVSPSLVMKDTGNGGIAILAWLLCGFFVLGCSLCYCELGCAVKRSGGTYAFMLEAYGSLPAFLSSWTITLIVEPAAIAAINLTFGTYIMIPFEQFIKHNPWYPKAIAAGCILFISLVNCWSINAATKTQALFTFAQIISVAFVVVVGFWQLGKGHTQHLSDSFNLTDFYIPDVASLGAALCNVLWAYDGWALISNVTEEMINLERNLFLSVVTGIPFVILCYVLVNISFLTAMSPKDIGASQTVAVSFVQKTLGNNGAYIMSILVALSCYGSANGTVFATGRICLAAAREGHLPSILATIHKKRQTPIPAVLLTSFISLVMLIPDSSSLEMIISLFNFSYWIFFGLSIFGVLVLRYRKPDLPRPYKVWITTPIIMSIVSLFLVANLFVRNPVNPGITTAMIALGIPVYYLFIYLEPKHPRWFTNKWKSITNSLQKTFNLTPCR